MAAADYFSQVQKIYVAYYGRPADPAGLSYWGSRLDAAKGDLASIINAFGTSSESTALYTGDNAAKVTAIYQQLFNRAPDTAGLNFYTGELTAGRMTAASIALNVANGASGTDATYLSNKLTVASAFTDALNVDSAAAVAYAGTSAATSARSLISGVTTSAATTNVASTVSSIKSGGGAAAGQTFTLTTGTLPDVPTLTTGSDTISGPTDSLKSGDVIADSSSTDRDVLTIAITGSATNNKPVISNIETVNIDFKGFGVVYDAASTTNGTIVVSSSQEGNSTATLNNVGAATSVQVGSGIDTLSLASSATTLKLTGGQALTVSNNATAGSLALTSNGSSANTVTYSAAVGSKALTVTGSTSLTIKSAALATDFGGNTVTNTLSGGSRLTIEATALTASADLSKVAFNALNLNTTGTQSLTLATGSNVTLSKDIGASTLALTTDASADVLNLTLGSSQTAGALSLTNFETVNLGVATSSPATISTLTLATATNAQTINVTGSKNLTVSTLTASAQGTTFDATSFTGVLSATVGTNAATVVGGAGNDTLTGGTAADLLAGGVGNDTLNAGGTAGGTVADTILGGAGSDTIVLSTANLASIGAALVNGGAGTDSLSYASSVADTLTGKVVAVESVSITNTVGAITWTTADSDITADSTLVFTLTGAASTGVLTFNAAAETDAAVNLTVTNNAANVITGGALADTITLITNSKANTITGGKGADSVTLSAGATGTLVFAAGDSGVTLSTADSIAGTVNTDEVLRFSSITATAQSSATATSAQMGTGWTVDGTTSLATKTGATVADFITAATAAGSAGSSGMNGQLVAFTSGADTYIFYAGTDSSSNADDGLIKIVGTLLTDLDADNTIASGQFII